MLNSAGQNTIFPLSRPFRPQHSNEQGYNRSRSRSQNRQQSPHRKQVRSNYNRSRSRSQSRSRSGSHRYRSRSPRPKQESNASLTAAEQRRCYTCKHYADVLRTPKYPLLLGMPFLSKHCVTMSLGPERFFTIKGKKFPDRFGLPPIPTATAPAKSYKQVKFRPPLPYPGSSQRRATGSITELPDE